jgi:integrase/recombinase XerD
MNELVAVNTRELTSSTASPADHARLLALAFLAGYSGRTREAYTGDLAQWWDWCDSVGIDVLAATRAHAQVYTRHLDEQLHRAPATVARKLSAIAGFYGYCVIEGLLERSPVAHVRRPRVAEESPRFGLDRAELGRLLDVAETNGPVAYALCCLLALNGLRVSEACGATVADLDTERGHRILAVRRKGGKRARVPLAPRTAAALDVLPSVLAGCSERNGPGVDPLLGDGAAPGPGTLLGLDRFAAHRLIRRLAAAAGITKTISPHSLRHTFVTLALDAGVELRDVQDAAGHADPRTTRRYDRGRNSLDRHATYRLTAFLDGAGH